MRTLLLFVCVFVMVSGKAQEDVPPPIETINLVTDKGIQYKFPDNIEQALNKAIGKEERDLHFIRLQTINDSIYTLMVYCLNNPRGETTLTFPLIKITGRFYQYKSKEVPIVFHTDYLFSTPGFAITHSCYMLTFKNKNNKGIILQEE